jgi:hypothetical protein
MKDFTFKNGELKQPEALEPIKLESGDANYYDIESVIIEKRNGILEKRIEIENDNYKAKIQDRYIQMNDTTGWHELELPNIPDGYSKTITVHEKGSSYPTNVKNSAGTLILQVFNAVNSPKSFAYFDGTWKEVA